MDLSEMLEDQQHNKRFRLTSPSNVDSDSECSRRLTEQETHNEEEADAFTLTSYKIAYQIAQKGVSFTDGKYLKEVIEMALEAIYPPGRTEVHKLELDLNAVSSRISEMAEDLRHQFNQISYDFYSIIIDESLRVGDILQLAIYARVWDNSKKTIVENLLEIVPIKDRNSEAIFGALIQVLDEYCMPLQNMVSLIIDGAPAMIENIRSVGARIVAEVRKSEPKLRPPQFNLKVVHCMINHDVLCLKTFKFDHILKAIEIIFDYIFGSPLIHHQFRNFLKSLSIVYECDDNNLVFDSNIRWLSWYNTVRRFQELKNEIQTFLEEQNVMEKYRSILEPGWQMDFCFLADVGEFLNKLHFTLQGENMLISDLYLHIEKHITTLQIAANALKAENLADFPLCQEFTTQNLTHDFSIPFAKYREILLALKQEFETRFQDIRQWKDELQLFANPFTYTIDSNLRIPAELHLELPYIESSSLQRTFKNKSLLDFYVEFPSMNHPNFHTFAIKMLTCFGNTNICGRTFNILNKDKSIWHSKIAGKKLKDVLKLRATKNFTPNFTLLAERNRLYNKKPQLFPDDIDFESDMQLDSDLLHST